MIGIQKNTNAIMRYKILGFKWLNQIFSPALAFVSADMNLSLTTKHFIHENIGNNCNTNTQAL